MSIRALGYFPLLLFFAACSTQPTAIPLTSSPSTAAPSATALPTTPSALSFPTAEATLTQFITRTVAATSTEPSGTLIKGDGQNLTLSNPDFYWTLKLPQDWVITADTGFEVESNNPNKTAFMHLLSQTWLTAADQD